MAKEKIIKQFEHDKSVNTIHTVPCINCHVDTIHKVLKSVDLIIEYTPDMMISWEQNEIIQCQGCESISFRKDSQFSESTIMVFDNEGNPCDELIHNEELFPSRYLSRKELNNYWRLPFQVKIVYKETLSALSNKLTILAAVGIRMLIESICIEEKTEGKNLEEKIDRLVGLGILARKSADTLHKIRKYGNTSAHEMKPLDEKTLDLSMDIVENLLQSVYIFPSMTK